MNENIGAKGGTNDRRKIINNKKRKKKSNLEQLESNVRRKQLLSLLLVIPLTIIGAIIDTFKDKTKTTNNEKTLGKKVTSGKYKVSEQEEHNNEILKIKNIEKKTVQQEEKNISRVLSTNKDIEKKIENLKTKRMIEEYEDALKELRRKLRLSYYEEEILEEAKYLENKPSKENLDKINKLIDKLEEYKHVIKTESIENTDYIETLISEENVIKENNDNSIFSEIKLKVEKLNNIEKNISNKNNQKKILKDIDEEKIDILKEEKENLKNYNNELLKFQNDQDKILTKVQKEIQKDINNSTKERIQLNGINISSNLTMHKIRRQMRVPGIRSGRKIHSFVFVYLYYFTMLSTTRPIKKKYKNIKNDLFNKRIESDINEINNILEDIKKANIKLVKNIEDFKNKYEKYKDSLEYKKVLMNFEEMKKSLEEKEYEIRKLREEQEKKQQESLDNQKVYKI